jgi:hypothetical protein
VRFWNTGSWIYEPTLGSLDSYERYLRIAWPGTAVLIDTERPEPELISCLADLNPLPPATEKLAPDAARAAYRQAREKETLYAASERFSGASATKRGS